MPNASNLSESAKEHASDLAAQAKSVAGKEAVATAANAKDTAAGKVQQAADAADAAADQLDPGSPQAQAVQQVANHIEDVATRLRDADVRDIAEQATEMARRNPMLFIGGAAIAGFAVARFLKARDSEPVAQARRADPWATSYAGSRDLQGDAGDHSVSSEINGSRAYD